MPESSGIDLCGFFVLSRHPFCFLYKKTENLYKFPVKCEEELFEFSRCLFLIIYIPEWKEI